MYITSILHRYIIGHFKKNETASVVSVSIELQQKPEQFWNRWTISDSEKKTKLIFVNYCGFRNVKSRGFSEVVARTLLIINISTKLME